MGVLEAVRRVEEAPLGELLAVDLEDVQAQMDHLLGPEIDAASLYRRWETQQWAVSELDFSRDQQDWSALQPGFKEGIRRTLVAFFIGEQAVTDTLSPLLHAAPEEDERIFLATQIADEARHTVFFQRFFDEVLGISGGLSAALEVIGSDTTEGYKRIFDHQLVEATERVRLQPRDERAWVEGIVTYHLVIEGYLALSAQKNTIRLLKAVSMLPGFVTGFTAVARDESRHIGFGVMALRRRVKAQPEMARVILRKVLELLEPAVSTLTGKGRELPVSDPNQLPPPMRINPLEAREFAVGSLCKRLRAVGLSDSAVGQVHDEAFGHYDESWADYEKRFGTRHPSTYYREGLVG